MQGPLPLVYLCQIWPAIPPYILLIPLPKCDVAGQCSWMLLLTVPCMPPQSKRPSMFLWLQA